MSETKKHREGFWAMVAMLGLHPDSAVLIAHAPLWAMIALTTAFGLMWALSAYADHLEAKLHRDFPDLMPTRETEGKQ